MRRRPARPDGSDRRARNVKTVVTVVLAMLALAPASARTAELRLRPQCQSRGSLVTLADVAEIFAADGQQAETLAAVELFPAPAASTQRFVRARELQDLLLLRGVDLAEHRFSGASLVAITGGPATVRIQPEPTLSFSAARRANGRVGDAVVQYLQRHVSADRTWNVEVELPESQARWAVDSASEIRVAGGSPPWTGRQRFEVTVDSAEGPVRFPLDVRIDVPPSVVVAVRALASGAIVQAGDVELRPAAAGDERFETIYSVEEVLGWQTTRALPEGKVLDRKSLCSPLLVRRRDPVTVYAHGPSVQVRTTARALDDGSFGETIRVESLLEREAYLVRIIGVREAEVDTRPSGGANSRQTASTDDRWEGNPTYSGYFGSQASAWEPGFAKLSFAHGEAELPGSAFPSRAWERDN
ncbi:MAG TPA: flagellar basal body P-ring formation chaperone FlgA [Thermoguttaceae bacterium]|nr:flagellar basal body P-ring formation chaperone FlgA [Thermoguttaceae bacterium]